jgi:hypothetical protein
MPPGGFSKYFKLPDAVLGVRMLTRRQKCEHWTSGSVLPDLYKSFEFMKMLSLPFAAAVAGGLPF